METAVLHYVQKYASLDCQHCGEASHKIYKFHSLSLWLGRCFVRHFACLNMLIQVLHFKMFLHYFMLELFSTVYELENVSSYLHLKLKLNDMLHN